MTIFLLTITCIVLISHIVGLTFPTFEQSPKFGREFYFKIAKFIPFNLRIKFGTLYERLDIFSIYYKTITICNISINLVDKT